MKSMHFKVRILILTLLIFTVGITFVKGVSSDSLRISTYTESNYQSKKKSLEAFDTILTVIKSPRCMNCHPTGDRPRQGDNQKIHLFNVQRGIDDKGTAVQKCATCHQVENNSYTNIPGAPHWQLAPKSMGWYGLSDFELGKVLVDTMLNGGRTPEQLVHHMSNDSLVLWAWNPGGDRLPPSIPFDKFKIALTNWLENGSFIPEK